MKISTPKLTVIALALCLAGALLCGALLALHADPHAGGVLTGVCRSGCAETVAGASSRLVIPVPRPHRDLSVSIRRLEVPVAFVGLAYFVFMGAWYLLANGRRAPLHAGLYALPVSAAFLGIMAFGAAPWCVACSAVHAINGLLVLTAWRLARQAPLVERRGGLRPAFNAVAVASAMVGGLWLHHRTQVTHQRERAGLVHYRHLVETLQTDPEFLAREHATQPRHEFALRPTESVREDGHQLVVFSDFACPACFCNAARIHDEIIGTFEGRLDVLVRHLPAGDSGAARAAEAARLLGGEEAFRWMYRLLFLDRERLGPDLYRSLAAELGLDPDELIHTMDAPEVREVVEGDIKLAHRLGVDATPTMFLDGRRVTELCRTPLFWKTVAAADTDQRPLANR